MVLLAKPQFAYSHDFSVNCPDLPLLDQRHWHWCNSESTLGAGRRPQRQVYMCDLAMRLKKNLIGAICHRLVDKEETWHIATYLGELRNSHVYWSSRYSHQTARAILKGLAQSKIIKKSVILFWLIDMTMWCKHVHRLELQKFFLNFCAAHFPVRLDIETKLLISNYWQPCQK